MEEQFEKVHALGRGAQGSVILVRRKADSSLFVIKQIFMEEHKKEDRQQIMNEIKVRTSSAACLPAEGWQTIIINKQYHRYASCLSFPF